GRDFDFRREASGWRRARGDGRRVLPLPPFGGEEQYANAAACAAVVDCLAAELPVGDDALASGIGRAYLRGRFERREIDGVEWVFDVAHNPAAVAVLAASVARLPRAPRTLAVFAAMRDKDLNGVVAPFSQSVDAWFVTQANAERGATGEELRDALAASGARAIETAADVAAATAAARAAAPRGARVLVFGSFLTVGAAADALGLYCAPSRQGGQPATWTRV
ncbi:MAG TPA: cyanophycin synthetase, partial [Gammaproteobacteria bacterium]|nr:cyanophycin synthetase [Gammaproteobacteria bacterium]